MVYVYMYVQMSQPNTKMLTRIPVKVAKRSSSGTELMREMPIPCSRMRDSYMHMCAYTQQNLLLLIIRRE